MTVATIYNYNEPSEKSPCSYEGFRNINITNNKDFILGGMFPVSHDYNSKQNYYSRQTNLEMLEAMLFAIDRINNDMNLLPNLTIGYDVRDTFNSDISGLWEAYTFYKEYIAPGDHGTSNSLLGVVGPAYSTVSYTVANFLSLKFAQIPLVSYASSDAALSNKDIYKYFLRTFPSDTLQASAMVDLMSYFEWEYVSVISNNNEYGDSVSNAFIDVAGQHNICLDHSAKIDIPPLEAEFNKSIVKAVRTLLKSSASVVVVFSDEDTVLALFEELKQTNSSRKFMWIASDRWTNSHLVYEKYPEIAKGTFGFQLHTEHVEEFADYFSQLTPSTNIRDLYFLEYYKYYCNENGTDCPNGVTSNPKYSQGNIVPLIIDAVYVFAHALQNFLNDNCDSPIRWNRDTQQCDGMKYNLTGQALLSYLLNVSFSGIQNRIVSFDEDGDPIELGVYEITHLQINESGQYEYASVGFWNPAYKEKALILNNIDGIEKVNSSCSEPCSEGMIVSINNENCPSCFECIPCVGPTYSMNSTAKNCSLCGDNHWGNDPLSGSTQCVPVKVRHLDFSSGWSIVSMCIASIALIILVAIIVIFVIHWNTPVVKSLDREQMVMLLFGIGICCILTYVTVAPPSTAVCVFQRIGVWLCFSLAFGALLLKIVRIAKIFYSIESSAERPSFIDSKYQITFTLAIVFGQLILVAIGLGIDPPVVKRDPEEVRTSYGQFGIAPEIIETCQQPHTAILVLSVIYNTVIIIGCIILGWMTRRFPDNFNEAERVMFTSFTLMVIWVLFVPLYFYTKHELQMGVLSLGINLSAVALIAGIFFPRVYIILFQKHKNTREYVSQQNYKYTSGTTQSSNSSIVFQQSKKLILLYGSQI